jgi:hypothetical protein
MLAARAVIAAVAGVAVLGLTAQAALAAPAAPAAPAAKPSVTLKFANAHISHTSQPVVDWTSKNVPSGSRFQLQRQFGSAHVWKGVQVLSGRSGSAKSAKVQMGRYAYRIQVHRSGKVIATSSTATLYSYAAIPLTNLCNEDTSTVYVVDTNGCEPNTVQVGGTVFTYLIEDEPPAPPQYDQDVKVGARTSCRSISLQWALDNNAPTSDSAQVEVVQATADPQTAKIGQGKVGSKTMSLAGGAWYLNLSDSNGDNEYVNATLSCWSANALT